MPLWRLMGGGFRHLPFLRSIRLEAVLNAELHRARAMRIHRVQERIACQAVRASREISPSRIIRSAIAAHCVAAGIPAVWIEEPELRVVKDIEGFRPEFDLAALVNRKVLQ